MNSRNGPRASVAQPQVVRRIPPRLALAWVAAGTLLTGCQTFNYTEEDWDRERERAAAWAAEAHRYGSPSGVPSGFGPLHLDPGSICIPSGAWGGACAPSAGGFAGGFAGSGK